MKRLFPKLTFLFLLLILFALTNCKPHATTIHKEAFDNLRSVVIKNNIYTLIDGSGKEIMTFPDSTVVSFGYQIFLEDLELENNLILLSKKDVSKGFINKNGKEIIQINGIDYLSPFFNGYAKFEKEYKYGYLDTLFQIKIKNQYKYATNFSCNRAFVSKDGSKWGVLDNHGKEVSPFIFDYINKSFSSYGVKSISVNKKYGVIDTNGTFILEPKYDYIAPYSDGWALVEHQDSVFYINTKGKKVLDVKADHAGSFHEGLAWINMGGERSWVTLGVTEGLWGAINKKGEVTIFPKHSFVGDFNNGVAPFSNGERYGIINHKGDIILDPTYESISNFRNSRATILNKNYFGVIKSNGKIVVPIIYDFIFPYIKID